MSSTDQNTPAVAAAGAAAVQQNNAAAAALEAIGRQQQTLIDSTANLLMQWVAIVVQVQVVVMTSVNRL